VGVVLVHKDGRDSPWARIKVLVGAPASKINLPVVEFQDHIAGGVGQVKPHNAALSVTSLRDFLQVKELASVVLDSTEHDHRN